jgi:hypothetical protein
MLTPEQVNLNQKWLIFENLPSHVSAAGDNLVIVEEPTTTEIACVAGQLSAYAHVSLPRF